MYYYLMLPCASFTAITSPTKGTSILCTYRIAIPTTIIQSHFNTAHGHTNLLPRDGIALRPQYSEMEAVLKPHSWTTWPSGQPWDYHHMTGRSAGNGTTSLKEPGKWHQIVVRSKIISLYGLRHFTWKLVPTMERLETNAYIQLKVSNHHWHNMKIKAHVYISYMKCN